MRIIAVGDIMPGGILNQSSQKYVSKELCDLLSSGDVRIGTLETAVGNTPDFYKEKMERLGDVIYVKDEDLGRLKELNINVVSLANNHIFDLGEEGVSHTQEVLDQLGIRYCGVGRNLEEASKPVVIEREGKRYCIISFCDWRKETVGWCPLATNDSFGVNPMFEDHVVSEIKKYKKLYDYVIVLPHWGIEYRLWPTVHVWRMSNIMIKAGADMIFGSHAHCVQPVINKKGKCIAFGLGNFLFPDRLICPPRSTYYPETTINIKQLPVTSSFPYVEEVTYKKWCDMATYGLIVVSELGRANSYSETYFTHLKQGGYVELVESNPYWKKVVSAGAFASTYCYPVFDFSNRLINFVRRKMHQ